MNHTFPEPHGDGHGAIELAIQALKQEPVPPGPDRALTAATLDRLRSSALTFETQRRYFTRSNVMRLFTTAAAVLVLVSLTFVATQVTHAPSSAFGHALMQLRGAGAMSYVQTIAVEGQPRLVRTRTFVSEDGRNRTEQGNNVTIFDSSGRARITLVGDTKTAIVSEPRPLPALVAGHKPLLQWLEMLRELGDRPDKVLETKEIDGKPARGYVATRVNQTFTLWVDEASGDPVLVEYDNKINGKPAHITMSDFRFGEVFPESYFSFEVPPGYKVYGRPEDGVTIATRGLESAWSDPGFWRGVTNADGGIYALEGFGQVHRVDCDGKRTSTTLIGDFRGRGLRTARLKDANGVEFLTFRSPGDNTVRAYQADGTLLWSFSEKHAVNDVCPFDLDGDGLDEVIVSYNGSGGIRMLNSAGELRWSVTDLRNVWHVTAGQFAGDGRAQVAATAVDGKVHLFDIDGNLTQELEPGFYATLVRPWRRMDNGKDVILVAGGGQAESRLASIALPGKADWSIKLSARVQQAASAVQRPWLAISLNDGSVRAIELTTGKEFAQVGGHGGNADVAWLEAADKQPLLIVADGKNLVAYRVTAEAATAAGDAPAK